MRGWTLSPMVYLDQRTVNDELHDFYFIFFIYLFIYLLFFFFFFGGGGAVRYPH